MNPPPRQALLRRIQRLNVHTWFGVHRRLDWPRPKSQSLTLSPSVHLRPSRSPSAACSSNPSPWALRGFTCFILTTGCTSTRAKRFRGSKEARREPPRDRSETLLKAAGKEVAPEKKSLFIGNTFVTVFQESPKSLVSEAYALIRLLSETLT